MNPLLSGLDVNKLEELGIALGELLIFETFFIPAAAILDDQIHVIGRDVLAANVAIIIVLTVKWADDFTRHATLGKICWAGKESGSLPFPSHANEGVTLSLEQVVYQCFKQSDFDVFSIS
jgi:hypothetical protein